jgi:hypothetical protein
MASFEILSKYFFINCFTIQRYIVQTILVPLLPLLLLLMITRISSREEVTFEGVLDWRWDLLTTLTHIAVADLHTLQITVTHTSVLSMLLDVSW